MMNPGPIEEAGATTRSALKVFEGYPVLLTLVLFQIVMFGVTAWAMRDRAIQTNEQFKLLLTQCGPKHADASTSN